MLRLPPKLAARLPCRERLLVNQSCRCATSEKRKNDHVDRIISPQKVENPTRHELCVVALHQAIPFVGFGIMDNAILILAGEAIDVYLGAALGLSTMCAAAIGNIISNWSGVGLGTMIEDAMQNSSTKIKRIPPLPKLTHEQRSLRSVRLSGQLGCAAGLTVGCVIGMIPLLFFPNDHTKGDENGDIETSIELRNKETTIKHLEKEIHQWKKKHEDVLEKLKAIEKEKGDETMR